MGTDFANFCLNQLSFMLATTHLWESLIYLFPCMYQILTFAADIQSLHNILMCNNLIAFTM